jgi:hypothetical protein
MSEDSEREKKLQDLQERWDDHNRRLEALQAESKQFKEQSAALGPVEWLDHCKQWWLQFEPKLQALMAEQDALLAELKTILPLRDAPGEAPGRREGSRQEGGEAMLKRVFLLACPTC